ncbi:MAG: hypothetical protein SCM11_00930 [Bacillota bacterium]|nr:hypothetical protein [Bacillota bacterium]
MCLLGASSGARLAILAAVADYRFVPIAQADRFHEAGLDASKVLIYIHVLSVKSSEFGYPGVL